MSLYKLCSKTKLATYLDNIKKHHNCILDMEDV